MKLEKGVIVGIRFIPENKNSKPYNEKFDAPKVIVDVRLDRDYILNCNIYPDLKAVTSSDITEEFVETLTKKLLDKKVLCANYKIPGIRHILKEVL